MVHNTILMNNTYVQKVAIDNIEQAAILIDKYNLDIIIMDLDINVDV